MGDFLFSPQLYPDAIWTLVIKIGFGCLVRVQIDIKEASFRVTIAIGVAAYPKYAGDVNTLVDMAKKAMKKGRDEGKDQAALAE